MNDEACVTARGVRMQLETGREWLMSTFGVAPRYSWAIDPFGHSSGQARVLASMGYEGMIIQRIHERVKRKLKLRRELEFWWDTGGRNIKTKGRIFTHILAGHYTVQDSCGPDPLVCCQFDFSKPSNDPSCPGRANITYANVAARAELWLSQVRARAAAFRSGHVLVLVGDDFRFVSRRETEHQYLNYARLFRWIGVHEDGVTARFSTVSSYFAAVERSGAPARAPVFSGSFYPYMNEFAGHRQNDFWTGYFTSKIRQKSASRRLEALIAAYHFMCVSIGRVDARGRRAWVAARRDASLFLHHDGITGTSKPRVLSDYSWRMRRAISLIRTSLVRCLGLQKSHNISEPEHVFVNPTGTSRGRFRPWEVRSEHVDECRRADVENARALGLHIESNGALSRIGSVSIRETVILRPNARRAGTAAGAYIMASDDATEGLGKALKPTHVHFRSCDSGAVTVTTTFGSGTVVRELRAEPGEAAIKVSFKVALGKRFFGEVFAAYAMPSLSREGMNGAWLCTDAQGLHVECHAPRPHLPLAARIYPAPTLAWVESVSSRLTIASAQPSGVAWLGGGSHRGSQGQPGLVMSLDRRSSRDDGKGLGMGLRGDSKPSHLRFALLVETRPRGCTGEKSVPNADFRSYPSPAALRARTLLLNPVISLPGRLPGPRSSMRFGARLGWVPQLPLWNTTFDYWSPTYIERPVVDGCLVSTLA